VPLAFVLNLDAEHELERGARWTAPRSLSERLDAIAAGMRLPEGAVRVLPGAPIPEGSVARFWCPTPRAIALARAVGARIEATPPAEVLRRVNARAFCAELAEGELGPTFASRSVEAIEAFVAQRGPTGRWRIKRALGASGRGQLGLAAGALTPNVRNWLSRSVALGLVHVEPEVAIEREVAVYGWVRDEGVTLTGLRGQACDARGTFLRCARIEPALLGGHARFFFEGAERAGAALREAGYRGPFGTDGYLHREGGALRVRALSEINARYCMGWDERDGF
jgi:hypothetical protein